MADKIEQIVRDLVSSFTEKENKTIKPYDTEAKVIRVDGKTAWVHIPNGVDETPVKRTTNAQPGDTVQVRVAGGRAWLTGNATNPPTDDTRANVAYNYANYANENAETAIDDAARANQEANRAYLSAEEAKENAERAHTAAEAAVTDAGIAKAAATEAKTAATEAKADAADAKTAANEAKTAATEANTYARGALTSAATVQSVVDTVSWLAEHAAVTDDTTVDPDKNYYKKNQDGTYVLVDNPTGNPHDQGLYEMDDAVSNYVAAHLALATHGLELVLDESSYRIHIGTHPVTGQSGTDGVYIIDQNGNVVSYFGENIRFSDNKRQYIGNNNAYVIFDPANGGSISIGGANITLGDTRSLDDVLASMDSTISNTLIYDHTYEYDSPVNPTTATFTAFLYRGGVDVKYELDDNDDPKYPPSQFTWYLKKEDEDGIKEVPIPISPTPTPPAPENSGYQCVVDLADCGYGAEVIGKFTSLEDAQALDTSGNNLTNVNNEPLSVRATGDTVRVRDLTTSSIIFPTDKFMVVGSEDEHLVTIQTLQDYLNVHLDKQVLFDTTAGWSAQTTLVSDANTLYIYTDYQRDSSGHAVAGIKAGDGLAYVVDLPFTDAIAMEHIADATRHITASERSAWNGHLTNGTIHVTASNKAKWDSAVKCYYAGTEQLVFTVV